LQQIFAENILRLDELDAFAAENRVYALDGLAERDFVFEYAPDSGIESVAVRKLGLSLTTSKQRRITLEADPTRNPKAVYDLMDSLRLSPFHVTQAEIKVSFAANATCRRQSRTFRISYPNWCGLKHEVRDLLIRQMLVASGIEPIRLVQAADAED